MPATSSVSHDNTGEANHEEANTAFVECGETNLPNRVMHISPIQAARETFESASSRAEAPGWSSEKNSDETTRPRLNGREDAHTSVATQGSTALQHDSNTTAPSPGLNGPAQEIGKSHEQDSGACSGGSTPCGSDEDDFASQQSEGLRASTEMSEEMQGCVEVISPSRNGERQGRSSGRKDPVSHRTPSEGQNKERRKHVEPSRHSPHKPRLGSEQTPGHGRVTGAQPRVPDEFDKMREVQNAKLHRFEKEATKLMQELQGLVKIKDREITHLRMQVSAGNAAWHRAQRQHEKDLRQLEGMRERCDDRGADNEGKQHTIENLSKHVEENEKVIPAQAQQIKRLEENLRAITGDLSDMERHRDMLRNDLNEKAGQLAEARSHNNDLQKRIKSDLESGSKILQEMASTIQNDFGRYLQSSKASLASGTNHQREFNIKLFRTLEEVSKSAK